MLPAVRKDNFYGIYVHISDREERFIDTDVGRAKRARDFTEFTVFYLSSYRLPKKKVSMIAYEGVFIIFAPLVISPLVFEHFLWHSISFTTRGPFNYSRCGITPTVIFVRA